MRVDEETGEVVTTAEENSENIDLEGIRLVK